MCLSDVGGGVASAWVGIVVCTTEGWPRRRHGATPSDRDPGGAMAMTPEAEESLGTEAPAPQRRRGAGRGRDTPHALASEIFLQCQYGRTPAAPRDAHGDAAA